MLRQEVNHTRFTPVRAAARPFNKHPRTYAYGVIGYLLEGLPYLVEKDPVFPNFAPTRLPSRPVDVDPRRTTRARAREPQSIKFGSDLRFSELNSLPTSKIHFLRYWLNRTVTRPSRSLRQQRSFFTTSFNKFGLGRRGSSRHSSAVRVIPDLLGLEPWIYTHTSPCKRGTSFAVEPLPRFRNRHRVHSMRRLV